MLAFGGVERFREETGEALGALVYGVMLRPAVLLITIANIATLALLRAERLHVEVSVIRALGASAAAARQRFVAESVVAALGGGMVSAADPRLLGASVVAVTVVAAAAVYSPARRAGRTDPAAVLRGGT